MLPPLLVMARSTVLQQLRRKAHLLQKAHKVKQAMGQCKPCWVSHGLLLLQGSWEASGGCVMTFCLACMLQHSLPCRTATLGSLDCRAGTLKLKQQQAICTSYLLNWGCCRKAWRHGLPQSRRPCVAAVVGPEPSPFPAAGPA